MGAVHELLAKLIAAFYKEQDLSLLCAMEDLCERCMLSDHITEEELQKFHKDLKDKQEQLSC